MDELKRAAAALGKKGGEKKVPKGFAKSGKASQAGKKSALKRWGQTLDVTVRCRWLPVAEKHILAETDRHIAKLRYKTSMKEAVAMLIISHLDSSGLRKLGLDATHFYSNKPRRVELKEIEFERLLDGTPVPKEAFEAMVGGAR